MIFDNLEDKNAVIMIDVKNKKVMNRYPLAPCEAPTGLAMDRPGRRLFVACDNNLLAVMNADNGKVITTLPIGAGADAVGYDSNEKLIFTSNGKDGTLTVIKEETPDRYSVIQTVATEKGARTLALDEKTHRLILVTGKFGPASTPTKDNPHARPPIVAGSVIALVIGQPPK